MTTDHVIGSLHTGVEPVDNGYRHLLAISCCCGWEVRGRDPVLVSRTAIDHLTGNRDDRAAMGFLPIVRLS